jgi:hypothetical protein
LQDQGFLLESSSDEDEWDRHGEADSLDLCEISTQDRELMTHKEKGAGAIRRRPQLRLSRILLMYIEAKSGGKYPCYVD